MAGGIGAVGPGGKGLAASSREADPAAFAKATNATQAAPPVGEKPPAEKSGFSWSDFGHAALDVAGMIPGVGEVADLANAGWYAAEGDYGNAALSAASAVPFAGNLATGAKWAKRGIEAVDTATDVAKTVDNAADVAKAADKAADAGKLPAKGGGPGGPAGPAGPNGPGTPGGGAPDPNLDGISYRKDLPQHLKGPDGFNGTRLNGTHNQDVAISEVKAKGFNPTVTPTGTKGINEVKWEVPNPNDPSKPIVRSKTTYDPKVFDDKKMLDMAQGAGEQGWAKHLKQPNEPSFDVAQDGVNFRVYVSRDGAGNAYIGNVHPIQ